MDRCVEREKYIRERRERQRETERERERERERDVFHPRPPVRPARDTHQAVISSTLNPST